jgi:hypothetical protein
MTVPKPVRPASSSKAIWNSSGSNMEFKEFREEQPAAEVISHNVKCNKMVFTCGQETHSLRAGS